MKKRIFSLLLAFLMVVSMIPTPAYSVETGETTPTEPTATEPTTTEPTDSEDKCIYCEETTAEDGTVIHSDDCNTNFFVDASADVGQTAAFNMAFGEILYSNEKPDPNFNYDATDDAYGLLQTEIDINNPPLVEIIDWHWEISGPVLWYRVKPLEGETLPEGITTDSWILQKYTDGDSTDTFILIDVSIIGKTVAIKNTTAALFASLDDAYAVENAIEADASVLTSMVVKDLFTDGIDTWYLVDAAEDAAWPETYAGYYYVKATDVGIVGSTEPGLAPVEKEETTASGVSVSVNGALPEGTALSVQDVTVDAGEFGIADTSTIVAALDIKLLDSNNAEYQPYEDETYVKVTLDAAAMGLNDGDVVRLHHKHDGEITVYEPVVVIDGKISFYAGQFSVYLVQSTTETTGTLVSGDVDSPYIMTVGNSEQIFYSPGTINDQYDNDSAYQKYYVWSVEDTDGVISYTVTNIDDGHIGIPDGTSYDARVAPWITVVPKKAGTVTLKMTTYYQQWTTSAPGNPGVAIFSGEETFIINVVNPTDFHIENAIAQTGCLIPVGLEHVPGVTYTWTRSDNKTVRPEALESNGVNVSIDRGGIIETTNPDTNEVVVSTPITYTVVAKDADGNELGRDSYQILYGSEVLNSSFEEPVGASKNWDAPWDSPYGYVTNGTPGLYWKTTTPGTEHNLGRDIEFGDATTPHGVGAAADGTQFVELNAEGFGTLYQDILTTPGATLSWSFSHTARPGGNNNMYIVMAASEYAREIVDYETINALLVAAKAAEDAAKAAAGTAENMIVNNGAGFEFTYNGGTYRIWNNYADSTAATAAQWENVSGYYQVPADQYLTRLFFASDTTTGGNNTMGNLIDGVTAGEFMNYVVLYYADNQVNQGHIEYGIDQHPNTTATLQNLQGYLNMYNYPAKILVNGHQYPGTLADLMQGLYITDYGEKIGDAANYPQQIVLQIYFQVPNIIVTKVVETVGMSVAEKNEILNIDRGFYADFQIFSADTQKSYTAGVDIIQFSSSGELTAENSFAGISSSDYGTEFTFSETGATQVDDYVLTTKIETSYNRTDWTEFKEGDEVPIKVLNAEGQKIQYIRVTNTYTRNVGNLTISKNVLDAPEADENKEFTFIVSGKAVDQNREYTIVYSDGTSEKQKPNAGKLTIKLEHGEYAVIENLNLAEYEVVEIQERYYTQAATGATGTITNNDAAHAEFTNTYVPRGNLKLTKFIDRDVYDYIEIDTTQAFAFTVTVDYPLGGQETYTAKIYNIGDSGHSLAETISLTGTTLNFNLKHNQYIVIEGLPAVGYTISEVKLDGYDTPIFDGGASGTIPSDGTTQEVVCRNPIIMVPGDLQITKIIKDDSPNQGAPKGMAFEFTVVLNYITEPKDPYGVYELRYKHTDPNSPKGTLVEVKTGDVVTAYLYTPIDGEQVTLPATVEIEPGIDMEYVFKLTLYDGLTATIVDLPPSSYQVDEEDYSQDGFAASWTGNTSGMLGGAAIYGDNPVVELVCTNTYPVDMEGTLVIKKQVTKDYERDTLPADTFTFKVTRPDGKDFAGTYTVTISDVNADTVVRTMTVETSTDADGKTYLQVEIPFTADELVMGLNDSRTKKLTIDKLPVGEYVVEETEDVDYRQTPETFMQTVTVGSNPVEVTFINRYKRHLGTITINKTVTGTTEQDTFIFHISGNGIKMDVPVTVNAEGKGSVTIYDLPLGEYTVTEDTSWSWRYTADKATDTATITLTNLEETISFTNEYNASKWLTDLVEMFNTFLAPDKQSDSNNG